MEISKRELKRIISDERKRIRKQKADKERARRLRDIETKIARYEPELHELTAKLQRLYERKRKLTEGAK